MWRVCLLHWFSYKFLNCIGSHPPTIRRWDCLVRIEPEPSRCMWSGPCCASWLCRCKCPRWCRWQRCWGGRLSERCNLGRSSPTAPHFYTSWNEKKWNLNVWFGRTLFDCGIFWWYCSVHVRLFLTGSLQSLETQGVNYNYGMVFVSREQSTKRAFVFLWQGN